MRFLRMLSAVAVAGLLVAGCGDGDDGEGNGAGNGTVRPTTTTVPGPPPDDGDTDENGTEGNDTEGNGTVLVEDVEVVALGDGRVEVRVTGMLPTPCHELASRVEGPNGTGTLTVVLEAEPPPPDVMCAQVLDPFSETIELAGLAPGTYEVVVGDTVTPVTVR